MEMPKEWLYHFMGGYLNGDGSYVKKSEIHLISASETLCENLQIIFNKLNVCTSKISSRTTLLNNKEFISYVIETSIGQCTELIKYCDREEFLGFNHLSKKQSFIMNNKRFNYIKKIEKVSYKGLVYCLGVDDDESFVANGIAISNCRFFSDNEPTVKAALRFYKEFPFHGYENVINDPIRKEHYDNLKENLNIDKILPMVAYEYFTMGDAFPFVSVNCKKCNGFGTNEQGEICDHEGGSISGITCLNPDWIDVQLNPLLPMDPVINLVPDDSLRQIILSKKPIEIYEKIPQHLRKKILQNQPILLSPRSVSHLKHDEVPYIGYGRSIIAPLFPILAYQDKLRQAQWIVADRHILPIKICKVGNDQRPASSADIRDTQNQLAQTANDPNLTLVTHHAFDFSWEGSCYTENTEVMTKRGFLKYSEVTKKDKIATYNPNTKMLEYHPYIEKFEYDYNSDVDGKIKKFNGKYYDVEVTSNHKMYAKMRKWDQDKYIHTNYQLIEAEKIIENSKFLGHIKWGGKIPKILPYKKIDILKDIDFDSFLKFVGFFVSEGGYNKQKNKLYGLTLSQRIDSPCYKEMLKVSNLIKKPYIYYDNRYENICAAISLYSRKLALYFKKNFGEKCENKKLPKWILGLPKEKLEILLDSLMAGDGSIVKSGKSFKYRYTTTSKKLSDDVQEIALKLGYSPTISITKFKNHIKTRYDIYWAEGKKNSDHIVKDRNIHEIEYKGKVWCFEVPNHIFIVRNNGKIGIHGNSGKVLQLTKEYELIDQSIIKGLGVNSALLSGEGPSYCVSQNTDLLTLRGFVKHDEFDIENDLAATFNKDTGKLEYQKAEKYWEFDKDSIDGEDEDLCYFKTNRIDFECTPNHRMLVKTRYDKEQGNDEWKVIRADEVKNRMSFRASVDGWDGIIPEDINEKCLDFNVDKFLTLSGFFVSEGYFYKAYWEKNELSEYFKNGNKRVNVRKTGISISQNTDTYQCEDLNKIFNMLSEKYNVSVSETLLASENWHKRFTLISEEVANVFEEYFGEYAENKKIPIWMKNLPTDKLQILLDSLVAGDGNVRDATKKKETDKNYYTYNTTSKQLRDDVMEIVIKLGRSPRFNKKEAVNENSQDIWVVHWSDSDLVGLFPSLESKDKYNKNIPCIHRMPYKGKVWCVTVPNGFIITQRNGLIAVHGNSTAAIGIEATIKRLKTVQNMMSKWICEKIYKTEARMKGFYKKDLSGNKVLDYPEIRWSDLNLRDESQRNNFFMQLYKEQIVSTQFICEKMGIDYDVELERVRLENVFRQQAGLVGPEGDPAEGGGLMGGGGIGGGGGGLGGGFKDPNKGNLPGGQSGPGLPGDEITPSMSGGESAKGGQPSGGAPMAAYETQLANHNKAKEFAPVVTRKIRIQEPKKPMIPMEQVDVSSIPETGFRLTSLEQIVYSKIEEGQKAGNLPKDFYIQQKPEPNRLPRIKVDFMSPSLRLIIQADGKQFHSSEEDIAKDIDIDARFAKCGWIVLRFTEDEIQHSSDAVLSKIINTCNEIINNQEKSAENSINFFKKSWADGGYCHANREYFDNDEIDQAFLKTVQTKKAHQLEAISEDLEELEEDFEEIILNKEEMENLLPEEEE